MTATSDTLRDRLRPAAAKLGWRSLLSLRWLRLSLMFALPVAIVIGGTLWYLMSGRYVSTDDAYVQADTRRRSAPTSPAASSASMSATISR